MFINVINVDCVFVAILESFNEKFLYISNVKNAFFERVRTAPKQRFIVHKMITSVAMELEHQKVIKVLSTIMKKKKT